MGSSQLLTTINSLQSSSHTFESKVASRIYCGRVPLFASLALQADSFLVSHWESPLMNLLTLWKYLLNFAARKGWEGAGTLFNFSHYFFMELFLVFTLDMKKMKVKSENEVAQSCPTLCDPMDSSLPGSAIRGIFQTRILEWAAISFSRGSAQPRDWTWLSCIADRRFTVWATREVHNIIYATCLSIHLWVDA